MTKKTKYTVSETQKIKPPLGMHNARCIRFLELGTHETDYGPKFTCQMSFELVDESAIFNEEKGEQNFVVHRTFFRSLGPRADMGKAVRAILGEIEDEVEMDDVLDGACMVEIKATKDKKYHNIVGIHPPPKGKVAKSENNTQSLYLDENFDQEVFDTLPDWLQDEIRESDEWEDLVANGIVDEEEGPKSKKGRKDDDDEEDEKPRRGKKAANDDEEDEKPRRKRQRPAKRAKERPNRRARKTRKRA